mmetsp:Transcript_84383/g.251518  ORF Transcript_84383/g.251518 Transcript_84383/m.251518 type:complete len:266 (+) Transcript_84383:84-881(+)
MPSRHRWNELHSQSRGSRHTTMIRIPGMPARPSRHPGLKTSFGFRRPVSRPEALLRPGRRTPIRSCRAQRRGTRECAVHCQPQCSEVRRPKGSSVSSAPLTNLRLGWASMVRWSVLVPEFGGPMSAKSRSSWPQWSSSSRITDWASSSLLSRLPVIPLSARASEMDPGSAASASCVHTRGTQRPRNQMSAPTVGSSPGVRGGIKMLKEKHRACPSVRSSRAICFSYRQSSSKVQVKQGRKIAAAQRNQEEQLANGTCLVTDLNTS